MAFLFDKQFWRDVGQNAVNLADKSGLSNAVGAATDGQFWSDVGSNAVELGSNIGGFLSDGQSWSDMGNNLATHGQNIGNSLADGVSSIAGAATDGQFWSDVGNNSVELAENIGGFVSDGQSWVDMGNNSVELAQNVGGFLSDEQSWVDMGENAVEVGKEFIPGKGLVDAKTDFEKGDYVSGTVNVLTEIPALKGLKSAKVGGKAGAKAVGEEVAEETAEKQAKNGTQVSQRSDGQGKNNEREAESKNKEEEEEKEKKDKECSPKSDDVAKEGCPISMLTGEELLELHDFKIESPIPITWKRFYRSTNNKNQNLGVGWTHVLCDRLEISGNDIFWHDSENRKVRFPLIAKGESFFHPYEQITLSRSAATRFCLKGKDQIEYHFTKTRDNWCLLSTIKDQNNNQIKLRYDANKKLVLIHSLTDQGKQTCYQLQRDQNQNIAAIHRVDIGTEEILQTLVRYQYDEQCNLVSVRDAIDQGENYAYRNHILVYRQLRSGFGIHFEWDQLTPEAKCLRQWGDSGYYDYSFMWNVEGYNCSRNGNGTLQKFKYNAQGRLIEKVDGEGHHHRYEYDQNGWLVKAIDPMGNETRYRYDERGNLAESNNPLGHTTTRRYNSNDQLISYSDERGFQWQQTFNAYGKIKERCNPLGAKTAWRYSSRRLPSHIKYDNGTVERMIWNADKQLERRAIVSQENESKQEYAYTYDEKARLATITLPDNSVMELAYDVLDRVVSTVRGGEVTTYRYDGLNRLLEVHHPDGSTEKRDYHSMGGLTCYQDRSGALTRWYYDDYLSQPTRRINADGSVFQYEYDSERNLVGLVNENGDQYSLRYDHNEKVIAETGFDGRYQQYRYNPAGYLIHSQDEDGRELNFIRDAMGQLREMDDSDDRVTNFDYSPAGALMRAENAHSVVAFTYDPLGQLVQEKQGDAVITHRYDEVGQRVATMTPEGKSIEYHYDFSGALTEVSYAGKCLTAVQRDALGRIVEQQQGALTTVNQYDPQGRLANVNTFRDFNEGTNFSPVLSTSYHYNVNGNVEEIQNLKRGATRYHYDNREQLSLVDGAETEHFYFDPAGNVLDAGPNARASQNTQHSGNRLAFYGDKKYTYDNSGNVVEERRGKNGCLVTRYTYNAQNQLVHAEKDGQTFEFEYDALGRRIRKRDRFGETTFIWNGDVLLSEQRKNLQRTYIYWPQSFVPLAFVQNEKIYHYRTDHIGTPQEVANDDGDIVWQVRYRAYGSVAQCYEEKIENPLRFQGQYYDTDLGLHYNRYRYYDPGVGRFVSQDPIGLLGGNNNYQYAPNPAGWVDPLGLSCKEQTPTEFAQSWQGSGDYPGVDTYKDITLKEGKVIYGGAPGQGNFYTTESALKRADYNAEKFFQGVQVSPHPEFGYRPGVTAYRITKDTPAAFGITRANPQHGSGGLPQIVIKDYEKVLEPIYSIPLSK